MKHHWLLDPGITYLNHGAFGATPRVVLERQRAFQEQLEREPVRFLARELEPLLDAARRAVAEFVNADAGGLGFVPNATAGVNAVLRSLDLDQHDELLVTTQEYNASRNALDHVAWRSGAKIVEVEIPFPIESAAAIVDRILERVTDRTRLLLVDHVTSQTALIFPVATLVAELAARGIDTLVDGAHTPGFLPLDLQALGAAYYVGNLHKWVSAPKGAAFLYVRPNRRRTIHPVAISHGANSPRGDRTRFLLEFDWTGTFDPSAWLSVPEALRFIGALAPGGWPEIMRDNRELALRARNAVLDRLAIARPAPDEMLGAMAAIPLPDGDADRLQDRLLFDHHIEVPVIAWPAAPNRLLRISAHVHNTFEEYERLAGVLPALL
ncbi:MAG TPA: aminotransferase class V-fold PLP-dependent enzyme [Thermoanaerobaculia bacterium]|jgi:isopenicillin-N epimerase